ncbi:MAG TPA: PH domain-containing protein [Longimicrobiaceae bacterium]|nr:PH domain-containing protein [Longimicrobiaceae bacterium]
MTAAPTPTSPAPLQGLPTVGAEPRPHQNLLVYYALGTLLLGPLFFIPLVPLYFRYHTLRYRFDAEGVTMRWGILFRREISLTYARIQDIHLSSNLVERWLGLARVQIQTASGSTGAEMTIEGLREFEEIRDFLYGKMRGARHHDEVGAVAADGHPAAVGAGAAAASPVDLAELTDTLRAVARELRALRAEVGSSRAASAEDTHA